MLSTYRRIIGLLDKRGRQRFALLFGMMLLLGLIDMAAGASILPFLMVVSNPKIVHSNPQIVILYEALDFRSQQDFILFLGLVTLVAVLFGQGWRALTLFALTRFGNMREFAIGSRLLSGYMRQPYVWFLTRHSADLGKSVLSETSRVVQGALVPALRLLAQGVVTVSLVGLLIVVHPAAAIGFALGVGGSYSLIFLATRRYLTRLGRDRFQANAERYRLVQEMLGCIKDVKLRGLDDSYLARFRQPSARLARVQATAEVISEVPRFLVEATIFGGMLALLLVLLFTTDGQLHSVLPVVGVYAFAGVRMFPAMQQLYGSLTALRVSRPSLDALHAELQEINGGTVLLGRASPAPIKLHRVLELCNVYYTYPEAERAALAGLSLTIQANTTVGIVGSTGAGKSTAVDIILGLLEPQKGTLKVDGTPIEGDNIRAWQRSLGYVPQHIFLTDDTVAANIAFGVPPNRIDMVAVELVARIAELHTFINDELPRGYETTIGERGVRLSGGQRQRIAIARALYHDPDVLILDEATSALDNLTERAVMNAVSSLSRQKTVVIVAHRLSSVQACDVLFMLEQGRCVAFAPYEELLRDSDRFRALATADT